MEENRRNIEREEVATRRESNPYEQFAQLFEENLNKIILPGENHEMSAVHESIEKINILRRFLDRNFTLFFSQEQAQSFIDRLQPSHFLLDFFPSQVEAIHALRNDIQERIR